MIGLIISGLICVGLLIWIAVAYSFGGAVFVSVIAVWGLWHSLTH